MQTLGNWRLALPVAALALAACGGEQPKTEAPAASTAESASNTVATEPRRGGNFIIATPGEPITFNELYYQDSASADIIAQIHAGLIYVDENFDVQPYVARELPTVSADGLQWTYHLRQDVKFHDGVQLTANDVAFTFGILKNPDYIGPRASDFDLLDTVMAVDDFTVQFNLNAPSAKFATQVGYSILPQHILADVPVAELGDYRAYNIEKPIGAGPFVFDSWTRSQNLVVRAFDDFFLGRPHLDSITTRFVGDQNAALLSLETGNSHYVPAVPLTEVQTARAIPGAQIESTLALRYDYIGWNMRNPLFQDQRVRQALTHGIDRQEIVETIMDNNATVAHAPVSPLSWAYNDDVAQFPYDPERAKALLADAGWLPGADGILVKDGQRFSFEMLSNDGNVVRRDIGVIAQQYLRQIGVEVRPAQMEWGAFIEKISPPNYNFDSIVLAWGLAIDPDPEAIWHSKEIAQGLNQISYNNPKVDALIDGNVSIIDPVERAERLAQVWAALAEDQPYTFLYYPQVFAALGSNVNGFTQHARNDVYKPYEWWLAE